MGTYNEEVAIATVLADVDAVTAGMSSWTRPSFMYE